MGTSVSKSPQPDLNSRVWDVAVVGAGPGGLFAALRAHVRGKEILIIDAGRDLDDRIQARNAGLDVHSNAVSGFGGAGMFSDGKLALSPSVGSIAAQRFPRQEVAARQHAIDEIFRDGTPAPLYGTNVTEADRLRQKAADAGLTYLHYPVRHVGTDVLPDLIARLRRRVASAATIACGVRCLDVQKGDDADSPWRLVVESGDHRQQIVAHNVVLAPGKVGSSWMSDLGHRLALPRRSISPKLGIRLEGPRTFLDPVLSVTADPKVIMRKGGGAEARTYCVCRGGDVVGVAYDGLTLVGGHSVAQRAENRTNMAILTAGGDSSPLTTELAWKIVARMNAHSGGGPLAQDVGTFMGDITARGQIRSLADGFDPSIPGARIGDIGPFYPVEITCLIREFIPRLASLCPEVSLDSNIIYAPVLEQVSDEFLVTDEMESEGNPGLFLVGDGPGLTGGVIGAADCGWVAGDALATRLAQKHMVHRGLGRPRRNP